MQKYIDLHTHTNYSPDADDSPSDMCKRAEELGLFAYAVTDHCEMNDFEAGGYHETALKSIKAVERYAAGRDSGTLFLRGIEMGQALENREVSERFYEEIAPRTDFIVGSLHNLKAYTDFAFLDYRSENVPDLLKRYFTELNELVRWGRFDSLAHITYPLRYIVGETGIQADLAPVKDLVDDLLRYQAEHGGAIEVNTSGLRQKIGETMPPLWMVRRFRELGGQYVTIGSDAHCTADLGKGLKEGVALIKDAGFNHITYYVRHQPVLLPIEV